MAVKWRLKAIKKRLGLGRPLFDYVGNKVAVRGVNLGFMEDDRFAAAWKIASELNRDVWRKGVPDIRWRAHVCCWAAQCGLNLKGDLVECGVYGGLLSITICEFLNFKKGGPKFWLFDTFHGIPIEQVPKSEQRQASITNQRKYSEDYFPVAQRNFKDYPNVQLVRGALPGSLADAAKLKKIAYLSMDLNSASAEEATIKLLWDKLVVGAVVVLDDYGSLGHETQYHMWNEFARSKGRFILTLPTGQGVLTKI